VRPDVLDALARHGALVSNDGTLRLYHATTRASAADILRTGVLLPATPNNPALRALRRGGSIFLASRPSILGDLSTADIVLAISIRPEDAPQAEVLRTDLGDPSRAEIELVGRSSPLPLTYARDPLAPAPVTSPEVAAAIADFLGSPVGHQLTDPAECRGRCKRASLRFVGALRAHGTDGQIIEWTWDRWWHDAVLIGGDLVIDWTVSQFDPTTGTFPELSSRARKDLHMLTAYSAAAGAVMDPNDPFLDYRVDPWDLARERIPISECDAQAFAANTADPNSGPGASPGAAQRGSLRST
jgi:hypothetical protein